VSLVALLVLGPWLIGSGRLAAGDLVAAVYFVLMGLGPAVRFFATGGGGWLVVMARLAEVTDVPAEPEPAPPAAAATDADLTIHSVLFGYSETAAPVLDGVDLAIPHGSHIAVVGPSGACKSILAALLCGLLTPDRGRVRIGGTELSTVHRLVALVPQEAYVSPAPSGRTWAISPPTLRTERSPTRSSGSGRQRRAPPRRLGRRVATGRAGLSAGERQLLTLVRAHLAPATVVVVDEATSHLEPATERRAELLFAAQVRTLIVIATASAVPGAPDSCCSWTTVG
jgi:ATP-binding cassette subfamily C protein